MRIGISSPWAVLAAAVAMYALGAFIYGFLFSDLWMSYQGLTEETAKTEFAGQEWRMALSPVMPLAITVGIALAMGWRGASGLAAGAATGALVGVLFLAGSRLYTFVYSTEPVGLLVMDSAHLILGAVMAGAVLGAWPKPKGA
jgi:hypothetical protein